MSIPQTQAIRAHLESGKSITGIEALSMYGCFRLPARIKNLKEQGMVIHKTMVRMNGKSYARYYLAARKAA